MGHPSPDSDRESLREGTERSPRLLLSWERKEKLVEKEGLG